MSSKFVVAIGSSAGGLKPLTSFFDSTPHDQATYIILRHLPLEYKSQLQQILERHSKLNIVEAENDIQVEKDTIYMQPSSMYMTIKNDRLYLRPRVTESLYPNWTLDIFLKSLAEEKGKFCIAVILSGSGTDGTKGISYIKNAGGMVLAQEPDSCEHVSMPQSAIKTGNVDYQLQPAKMPRVVLKHISEILKNSNAISNLKEVGKNIDQQTG